MNIFSSTGRRFPLFSFSLAVLFLSMTGTGFAADGKDWRPTYDLIMMWVNFAILVFVIVKFGKGPIMGFLRGQKETVAQEIEELEKQKESVKSRIQETEKALQESDATFEELKAKIIRQGELKKQEIIEQAHRQSEIMMENAKQKVGNQIVQAKRQFKEELIDLAVDLAEKKLALEITEEDNQRMMDQYLAKTTS